MIIAPGTWPITYGLTFAAAVAAAFAFSAAIGFRRGIPRDAWLALLTATLLGGMVGSKLLDFDLGVIGPGQKTILGGLVGGLAAAVLAAHALGIGVRRGTGLLRGGRIGGVPEGGDGA